MTDDADIISVYTDELIALSETARNPVRLDAPGVAGRAVSPVCGGEVAIALGLANGRVSAFGYEVDACALTRAVVAVMRDAAIGATRADIAAAGREMKDMLETGGQGPAGAWEKLRLLAPVKDYPARHNALLLPFEAVEKAFATLS